MFTITQTVDSVEFDNLVMRPEIWKGISVDEDPAPRPLFEQFQHYKPIYLRVHNGDLFGGYFLLHPMAPFMTVWMVHTILDTTCRGRNAIQAGKDATRHMFENTNCERLVSYITNDAPHTRLFAKAVGFSFSGETYTGEGLRSGKPVEVEPVYFDKSDWLDKYLLSPPPNPVIK